MIDEPTITIPRELFERLVHAAIELEGEWHWKAGEMRRGHADTLDKLASLVRESVAIRDAPPQMPRGISDRERTAYIRAHLRCPRCHIITGWIGEPTLVRQDADGELIATNQARCVGAKCGWSGLMDALVP